MLRDAVAWLQCPVCGSGFFLSDESLRCRQGHAFDIARQGYVNLAPATAGRVTGDTSEMVRARADFLGCGYYEPISQAVAEAALRFVTSAQSPVDECVVDAGAGTGYYLARVLDALPGRLGIALDVSKYAARRAARAHDRAAAVVCDTWGRLPVRDASAALILDVFAPRNVTEFVRVLSPTGGLVVVTPTQRHLGELIGPLGLLSVDERKGGRLADQLAGHFVQRECALIEWTMALPHADVLALVRMGPSARHSDEPTVVTRIGNMAQPVTVTASVRVSAYARAGASDAVGAV